MNRRLLLILLPIFLLGCDQNNSRPIAEIKVGGQGLEEDRSLPFRITAVYLKQAPSPALPFHVRGGDWTYFDCESEKNPKVKFTVGVASKPTGKGARLSWGTASLFVKDRESGSRFIDLFGQSFPGTIPTPRNPNYQPVPLTLNTAILGDGMKREQGGSFTGERGTWTATKWFLELDGYSGEVYFNYNLKERRGEFSEKDAEYAEDLLAILVTKLRDGPKPERTQENDPNLSVTAPTIAEPRQLIPTMDSLTSFSPKSRFAVYQNKNAIFSVSVDDPNSPMVEVARFDYPPWELFVLDDDLTCLVQESIQENPAYSSSEDPRRIWWVDFQAKKKTLLRGPEKGFTLAESPVSPDYRFIALNVWKANSRGPGQFRSLVVFDRENSNSRPVDSSEKDLSVIRWKMTDAGVRAVAVTNRMQLDENEASETYLVDPVTGLVEHQKHAQNENPDSVSPDEKYRVTLGKKELTVTTIADGEQRRFDFHDDDLRFVYDGCVEWVSPQYLKFNGPRLALIDVVTMKMCFPTQPKGMKLSSDAFKFSPDFRWAMYTGATSDGDGLFLAKVELPKSD